MTASGYRTRLADAHLERLLSSFPAVMINGARATGKTTTARQHAESVVRLDQPGPATTFRADPDAALRRVERPVLLDEWQAVPEVLPAVKRAVDDDSAPGQFLLTGSVRARLTTDMWAGTGRVVQLPMYGLTEREIDGELTGERASFLDLVAEGNPSRFALPAKAPDIDGYVARAVRSGFPEVVYQRRASDAREIWLASYLDQLVTRDAALVDGRKDPDRLRGYIEVLSLNVAGMPTDNTLYHAAGINAKTAASYDELLNNLFVLDRVPAWSGNRLKRLVMRPKRYVIDTGLAANAARVSESHLLDEPDLLGRFFDAFGTAQLRAEVALTVPRPRLHHLRTEGGRREVDLVAELDAHRVVGIEFKAAVAPDPHDARHLFWLRDELGARFAGGAVLHSGPGVYPLGDRVLAVPLCAIWG